MPEAPEVIALFGPTGVGKTAVALELGGLLEDPVAISADALQVYAGLETLTGAATAAEQQRLEHRLVGFVPVTQPFSVGDYMPLAHAEVDGALAADRRPIVVGGTGLYVRAAIADLSLRRGGDELWSAETRRPTLLVGLDMDRAQLYERIERRVEAIVKAGALREVRAARDAGASRTARVALGYEELLSGDIEEMKRRSRNLAKRQLTWGRKMGGLRWIDTTGRTPADVAAEIATAADPA